MLKPVDLKAGLRRGSSYLYELEALRGVAILLVFFSHTHGVVFGNSPHHPSLLMSFIVSGNTGVTLFFVLSGFLLSLPWLGYLRGSRAVAPNIPNFYRARALRIIPLYWAAVLVGVVFTGNIVSGAKAAGFIFVGFEMFPFSVIWWTLATEMQFYVLLPLCFWAWVQGGFIRTLLLIFFAAWLFYYVSLLVFNQLPQDQLSYFYNKSIFGRLPAFLWGILAAWVYLKFKGLMTEYKEHPGVRLASTALCIMSICALGLVLQTSSSLGERYAENHWHIRHTYESILWATIVLCCVLARPFGAKLLVNRPIAVVGKLSYSLYLIHVPVIFYLIYPAKEAMGVAQYASSAWLFINPGLALLISLGLSIISYRYLELPFLNMKRRIPIEQGRIR